MSLLLSRLRFGKAALVRSKTSLFLLVFSNGISTSLLQTSPYLIMGTHRSRDKVRDFSREEYMSRGWIYVTDCNAYLKKAVPLELVDSYPMITTIGASHDWIATLKDDGILRLLRLQDEFPLNMGSLNSFPLNTDLKRIRLPPLVTLPDCQTQIITNLSMSSSSPETDEDCVVAVKFLGPQLSFCRPATHQSKWINIRIENPCFFSSRVMFSKKDDMFRILGSGGHFIGSWDLTEQHKHKIQKLRFRNLPELTRTKWKLLHSCSTIEQLVESRATGETFVVKWYRKTSKGLSSKRKTKALMVFKLDEEGNAVFTQEIGDIDGSFDPRYLPSLFSNQDPDQVIIVDVDESEFVNVDGNHYNLSLDFLYLTQSEFIRHSM